MIIRVNKDKDNPYVLMNKMFLNRNDLSWQAKGMLSYLLSLPDDWQINVEDLKNRSTNKRDSTRNIINELINNGYIVREQNRNTSGKFASYMYDVFEIPKGVLPETGNPTSENPTLLNNNITNNNKTNIIPTLQEVEDYITAKGYNVVAHTFFNYYEALGWKDKNGKEVKNWKLKLLTWHNHSPVTNESLNNNKKKFKDYE